MAGANRRRSGNPAVRATPGAPADDVVASGSVRATINARSKPVLAALARLPRVAISALVLVLMLVGLSAPLPFALPAFAVLAVFVSWLSYLSWPVLDTRGRLVRAFMVAVVIGAAVAQLAGWL